MQQLLISYIKALMIKDYEMATKISKNLYKLGCDYSTQKVLIQDKELITEARRQLEELKKELENEV